MGEQKKNPSRSRWKEIEAAAENVLSAGDQIKELGDDRRQVSSQSAAGKSYIVSLGTNGSVRECGYKGRKGARCKHVVAVEARIMPQ